MNVFISFNIDHAGEFATWLMDFLVAKFIPTCAASCLRDGLEDYHPAPALIGLRRLSARTNPQRVSHADDFVRIGIGTAIDQKISITPVLSRRCVNA